MEHFLIFVIVLLSMGLGIALYLVYMHKKIVKELSQHSQALNNFYIKVLDNIFIRENVDVSKYLALTEEQIKASKGGENNE